MANKYKGEVEFDLAGKKLILVYDWEAIDQLIGKIGEDGMRDLVRKPNPARANEAILAGLKKHHPEVTKQDIYAASPPLQITLLLIDEALGYSYFGTEAPPKAEEAAETGGKKTS